MSTCYYCSGEVGKPYERGRMCNDCETVTHRSCGLQHELYKQKERSVVVKSWEYWTWTCPNCDSEWPIRDPEEFESAADE